MGWPAKSDKTGHSGFYDLRIERYKKMQNKNGKKVKGIKKGIKNLFGLLK